MSVFGVILVSIFPAFSRIRTEYLFVFSPNAGKWGKNADQNNSEYGLFLRSANQVLKYINEIGWNKSSGRDIPTKVINMAKEKLTVRITNYINDCISSSIFPHELKIVNIIPVYKKQNVDDKSYYRQMCLLPIIFRIFEKVLYSKLETVASKIFSSKLCGSRKGHSSHNSLLNLLKNWQKCLNTSSVEGTLLTVIRVGFLGVRFEEGG